MFGTNLQVESFDAQNPSGPWDEEHLPAIEETHKSSVYYVGRRVTGLSFGRGGDISCRIYDKTEELGMNRASAQSARAALAANEKAAREAEIWARHGWQLGEPVTRVEVQLRGSALDELCRRCEVKVDRSDPARRKEAQEAAKREMQRQLDHAVDGMWQYAVRKWLVLVVADETSGGRAQRTTRMKVDPWWQKVQEVSFLRKTEEPFKRVKRSSAARSAQALGAAMSLAALHGIHSPWIDTRKDVWELPSSTAVVDGKRKRVSFEEAESKKLEQLRLARWRLEAEVVELFAKVAPIVTEDLLSATGSDGKALERFMTRYNAASCRYAPMPLRKAGEGALRHAALAAG